MKRKKITREKLVRIIKRRDTQSLLAIQEDQFDWEVLKESLWLPICDDDEVVTLLEWIVRMGYVFKKEENLKRVVDNMAQTVAHIMAREGHEFDPERDAYLLRLADNNGWTVSHEMAQCGYRFDPSRHREILLLADSKGSTVAHVMAGRGYLFDPDRYGEICEVKDKKGYSVLECFIFWNSLKILFGNMDEDLMELSFEGIEKYMEAAERLSDIDVHRHLKKIFKIKKNTEKVKKKLEKGLGSLGFKL